MFEVRLIISEVKGFLEGRRYRFGWLGFFLELDLLGIVNSFYVRRKIWFFR